MSGRTAGQRNLRRESILRLLNCPVPADREQREERFRTCEALESISGPRCQERSSREDQAYCQHHDDEHRGLWEQKERKEAGLMAPEMTIETAIDIVERVIAIVDLVSARFLSIRGNGRTHLQELTRLQADLQHYIRAKAEQVKRGSTGTAESSRGLAIVPAPISISQANPAFTNPDVIEYLFTVVPALDDRNDPVELDPGSILYRHWFRELVLSGANSETLQQALAAKSINGFLQTQSASKMAEYIRFFNNSNRGFQRHLLHLLRYAVHDQTMSPTTPSIPVIGAWVALNQDDKRMTVHGWDLLHKRARQHIRYNDLAALCESFDDYVNIHKLLLFVRYCDEWNDTDGRIDECKEGVFFGFVPTGKGHFEPTLTQQPTDGLVYEVQSHSYVTGRMQKDNPMAAKLLQELQKRVLHLEILVWEGPTFDQVVYSSHHANSIYLARQRSARLRNDLFTADWKVTIDVQTVKNDLNLERHLAQERMHDYWQFLIIDRNHSTASSPSNLFQEIGTALVVLAGHPSPKSIIQNAAEESIPQDRQSSSVDRVVTALQLRPVLKFPLRYEGQRVRNYSINPAFIAARRPFVHTPASRAFEAAMIREMESAGVIAAVDHYAERVMGMPTCIDAVDGQPDLYFTTHITDIAPTSPPLPAPTVLLEFAERFAGKNLLFARGSIAVHYCAWPLPAQEQPWQTPANFATAHGELYHWARIPFDAPGSDRLWQEVLDTVFHTEFHFVNFYLTDFVIWAKDRVDAAQKCGAIGRAAARKGWVLMLPDPEDERLWTADYGTLELERVGGEQKGGMGPVPVGWKKKEVGQVLKGFLGLGKK